MAARLKRSRRRSARSHVRQISSLIRSSYARRLRVEQLEDRRLLAITVDTLVDEADGSIGDGDISLRDAIAAATSGETIDFSVSDTIALADALGQLTIDKPLTITGGSRLTLGGDWTNASQISTGPLTTSWWMGPSMSTRRAWRPGKRFSRPPVGRDSKVEEATGRPGRHSRGSFPR